MASYSIASASGSLTTISPATASTTKISTSSEHSSSSGTSSTVSAAFSTITATTTSEAISNSYSSSPTFHSSTSSDSFSASTFLSASPSSDFSSHGLQTSPSIPSSSKPQHTPSLSLSSATSSYLNATGSAVDPTTASGPNNALNKPSFFRKSGAVAGVFLLVGMLAAIQAFCVWSLLRRRRRRLRYKNTKYSARRAIPFQANSLDDSLSSPSIHLVSTDDINWGNRRSTLIPDENMSITESTSSPLSQQYSGRGIAGIGAGRHYNGLSSDLHPSKSSLAYPVRERPVPSSILPTLSNVSFKLSSSHSLDSPPPFHAESDNRHDSTKGYQLWTPPGSASSHDYLDAGKYPLMVAERPSSKSKVQGGYFLRRSLSNVGSCPRP